MSRRVSLFLIPILHQTTTLKRLLCGLLSCSSFQFYIKPQPITASSLFIPVVPHSNSTSNHNFHLQFRGKLFVVPHSNSTSNHNVLRRFRSFLLVVPHSNSTSNHNMVARLWKLTALFLIPILHQTTTQLVRELPSLSCSSFQFYIKPQLSTTRMIRQNSCSSFQFYIKPQPRPYVSLFPYRCSSFQFYIKPQRNCKADSFVRVVPHSNSTSNHNLAHGSNSYSARYTYDTDA